MARDSSDSGVLMPPQLNSVGRLSDSRQMRVSSAVLLSSGAGFTPPSSSTFPLDAARTLGYPLWIWRPGELLPKTSWYLKMWKLRIVGNFFSMISRGVVGPVVLCVSSTCISHTMHSPAGCVWPRTLSSQDRWKLLLQPTQNFMAADLIEFRFPQNGQASLRRRAFMSATVRFTHSKQLKGISFRASPVQIHKAGMAGRQIKMQMPQRRVRRQANVAVAFLARADVIPIVQRIVQLRNL